MMMQKRIYSVITKLQSIGVQQGDVVAIQAENSPQYAEIVVSCWQLGAVALPISTRYPKDRVKSILEDFGIKVFFSEPRFERTDKRHVRIEELVQDNGVSWSSDPINENTFDLQADASIILTSGSTVTPKAVLHTFVNHYFSALGSHLNTPFEQGDRWLVSLPMYHISGFSLIARALLKGGTLVFPAPKQSLTESIRKNKITHISLVPAQLIKILRDPACVQRLRGMKAILLGGAFIPSSLIHKASTLKLPVYRTYGSTEMASQITTTDQSDCCSENDSAGRPLKYRQVQISPNGEILVKGPVLFKGYLCNGRVLPAVDDKGFFATGYTGYFDRDDQLHVTGRKDLMFISGGENIYPQEIEGVLSQIDGVELAVVVAANDNCFGKRPVAFVKTQEGEKLDVDYFNDFLKSRIEKFKIPDIFLPWPEKFKSILKPPRSELQAYAETLKWGD
jgi:O-succinylbenzoic acid--CoA ligase